MKGALQFTHGQTRHQDVADYFGSARGRPGTATDEHQQQQHELRLIAPDAGASHSLSVVAIAMMNALFLIGLTYKVMTKRFVVAWDAGAIAAVYVVAVVLSYVLTRG